MIIEPSTFPCVKIITPIKRGDCRGYFSEVFKSDWFKANVANIEFVQDNQSLSKAVGTVRGLHFQTNPFAQCKLVQCIAGSIFDVVVDIRINSPTYGRWTGITLDSENGKQLWIPKGFAHGFAALEPDTIIQYKVTSPYSADNDCGLLWNDPAIGIDWPINEDTAIVSEKDARQPKLKELQPTFYYEAAL